MTSKIRPLTQKEKKVLEFIEHFICQNGFAPSYPEIQQHFELASVFSVQRYIKQLTEKGYISVEPHQKRSIQVLQTSKAVMHSLSQAIESSVPAMPLAQKPMFESQYPSLSSHPEPFCILPLMGEVAAGQPLEALYHHESVQAPINMIRYPEKTYALRVRGDSMIEDGICDQDIIFVEQRERAENGETVVAMVENEATVKKFFLRKEKYSSSVKVELRPANSAMKSLWFGAEEVEVKGVLVGLLRSF